jgi:hypothetical protein
VGASERVTRVGKGAEGAQNFFVVRTSSAEVARSDWGWIESDGGKLAVQSTLAWRCDWWIERRVAWTIAPCAFWRWCRCQSRRIAVWRPGGPENNGSVRVAVCVMGLLLRHLGVVMMQQQGSRCGSETAGGPISDHHVPVPA